MTKAAMAVQHAAMTMAMAMALALSIPFLEVLVGPEFLDDDRLIVTEETIMWMAPTVHRKTRSPRARVRRNAERPTPLQ
jgi:hypothetical protein